MTSPTMVFIHGGQHTAACWEPTLTVLRERRPGVELLAVDLPGRRNEPGDLATLTIDQCADGVVRQIEASGVERVMLVGHSMAGITMPGVITRLGAARVSRAVYVACCVPPQGATVNASLRPPVSWMANAIARAKPVAKPFPAPAARWMFANGMTRAQQQAVVAGLVRESAAVTREPVDRRGMPKVPSTWLLTLRDHALRPAAQRRFIANLGGVDEVVELDTCHNVMMSDPELLAGLLLDRYV